MTKTMIRTALRKFGVKGYSRAIISMESKGIVCGDYCGKYSEDDRGGKVVLSPIDRTKKELGIIVIHF